MVERVTLGRTDVEVSAIGVGGMTWGRKNWVTAYGGTRDPKDEAEAFRASLEEGVDLFDTAEMYGLGNAETRLGELARGSAAVIASKFAPFPLRTERSLPKALDRSLERLQREQVDLYQIHFPAPWISISRLMDRLADAVESGRARAVGVSNYSTDQMRQAYEFLGRRGIPLASNQVQYSLLYRKPEVDGVLETCRELGITLVAYGPLAMGALTGKYGPAAHPTDRMRRKMTRTFRRRELEALGPVHARLQEIGAAHGRSPAQVALRWLIEQGALPIPGAKDGVQARENAGALTFSLAEEECGRLVEVTEGWMAGPGEWRRTPSFA